MAHAARAAAEASRKASVAAANASLTITSPHSPEPVDVFNYDSDEKNDLKSDAGQVWRLLCFDAVIRDEFKNPSFLPIEKPGFFLHAGTVIVSSARCNEIFVMMGQVIQMSLILAK